MIVSSDDDCLEKCYRRESRQPQRHLRNQTTLAGGPADGEMAEGVQRVMIDNFFLRICHLHISAWVALTLGRRGPRQHFSMPRFFPSLHAAEWLRVEAVAVYMTPLTRR